MLASSCRGSAGPQFDALRVQVRERYVHYTRDDSRTVYDESPTEKWTRLYNPYLMLPLSQKFEILKREGEDRNRALKADRWTHFQHEYVKETSRCSLG